VPQARERRRVDTASLVAEVARLVQQRRATTGERLVEYRIAHDLGLSRLPLRRALTELARRGLLIASPNRGFVLAADWDAPGFRSLTQTTDGEEAVYLRIAADRLAGTLPERVSESGLSRSYDLGRSETQRVLARMAREGWIERRPGYGWQFLPTFPTREAYLHGYRYRLLVEPAALLEPGFSISLATLDRLESEQRRILSAADSDLGVAEMFRSGCSFHEGLVAASGNPFMLDAVERINRMRRLMEYRALDPALVKAQVIDHLAILAALRRGDRAGAAELLRTHLAGAAQAKLKRLTDGDAAGLSTPTL